MKKYSPSVGGNNEVKELIGKELAALIYLLEKGRYDSELDGDIVGGIVGDLQEDKAALENAVGTGRENVSAFADRVFVNIGALKKAVNQNMANRFEGAAGELSFSIGAFCDVLDGTLPDSFTKAASVAEKASWARRKLNARMAELRFVKEDFIAQEKRLNKEVAQIERDLADLDDSMLKEDNERKINELFRASGAQKSKLDMLVVRKGNCSACYNILDMIEAGANEILLSGAYSGEELNRAKAFLNMAKLKAVASEPDKALGILSAIKKDIEAMAARLKTIDAKVFGMANGRAAVSGDALAYKAELLRKKREREINLTLAKDMETEPAAPAENATNKTEEL